MLGIPSSLFLHCPHRLFHKIYLSSARNTSDGLGWSNGPGIGADEYKSSLVIDIVEVALLGKSSIGRDESRDGESIVCWIVSLKNFIHIGHQLP